MRFLGFAFFAGFFFLNQAIGSIEDGYKKFKNEKQELLNVENKQRQVLSALYQISKNVKKIVTEKAEINDQKLQLSESITQLSPRIQELENKNELQLNQLGYKLKQIYIFSGKNHFRTLFGSQNPHVIERQLKQLAKLTHFDRKQADQYKATLKELNKKQSQLIARIETLKKTEQSLAKKEARLLEEIQMKNKILSGIKKQKLFAINKMKQIKDDFVQFNTEDSGVLDALFKPSFMEQMGQLQLPISSGQLTQSFGIQRFSPSTAMHHKGLFFTAPFKSPIFAVFDGQVVFKGPVNGFGQTLIIDHGDHYYSVYSAINTGLVDVGQQVKARQVIALSGESEIHSQTGLYFEIRHFSEPYDPSAWLKGLTL